MDTNAFGIPFMEPFDSLADLDEITEAMALAIGERLPKKGIKTTGLHVVGTPLVTPVVFATPYPAGVLPAVFVQVNNSSAPQNYSLQVNNVTQNGFDIVSHRSSGTAALDVVWLAVRT